MGIMKKGKEKDVKERKVSWGQAQTRLMGTGLEYKENIESRESSFSFRDSVSHDRLSLEQLQRSVVAETLVKDVPTLPDDFCQFSDMFVQGSNVNTVVVPSEHNLDQPAEPIFHSRPSIGQRPLPQFTDKTLPGKSPVTVRSRNNLEPKALAKEERLDKMHKFL